MKRQIHVDKYHRHDGTPVKEHDKKIEKAPERKTFKKPDFISDSWKKIKETGNEIVWVNEKKIMRVVASKGDKSWSSWYENNVGKVASNESFISNAWIAQGKTKSEAITKAEEFMGLKKITLTPEQEKIIAEKLAKLDKGENVDIVFSYKKFPTLHVTYEVYKSGQKYIINRTVDGWQDVAVSREKLIKLMRGEDNYEDLDWK